MEMAKAKWKKLINDSETVSYVKNLGEYRIIIEARHYPDGWEIIKKYVGSGINFSEQYTAQTSSELKAVLKQLRSEKELTRTEIRDIARFKKKNLRVSIRRAYKTDSVEKWHFSIQDNFANFITVRYGKELDVDIVMEEQLKYIEEKILGKLYETLGLDFEDAPISQHVYYFSKKTDYYLEAPEDDVEVEFVFE